MPLNKVADEAMDNVAEAHKKAGIELSRRLIEALHTFNVEASKAQKRLTFATWVIVLLTFVLVGLTMLIVQS